MDDKPTPLDILLRAMHRKWEEGDCDGAASLARVAAPYLHPRLSTARQAVEIRTMSDAEIDALCRAGEGRAPREDAPEEDPEQPG